MYNNAGSAAYAVLTGFTQLVVWMVRSSAKPVCHLSLEIDLINKCQFLAYPLPCLVSVPLFAYSNERLQGGCWTLCVGHALLYHIVGGPVTHSMNLRDKNLVKGCQKKKKNVMRTSI